MTSPSPRDPQLVALPHAAALLLWTSAYLRGDIGPDDVPAAAAGPRADAEAERDPRGIDLFDWLTGLRHLPLLELRLVLPVPGRIAGLIGPPAALPAALEAEQAIVAAGAGIADHTLVPTGPGRWERFDAPPGAHLAPGPSGGGREDLLRELHRAASRSLDLDIVPDEAVDPDRLPAGWVVTTLPAGIDPSAVHLLVLAARTLVLTRLELDDGSAHTHQLADEQARRDVLAALHDAARTALVEAVERVVQPSA